MRARRIELGITPSYKRVDTCAAEFEAATPYMYSSYDGECESEPTDKRKVLILGGGPNRIGQGIEFDYCCCHASFALRSPHTCKHSFCLCTLLVMSAGSAYQCSVLVAVIQAGLWFAALPMQTHVAVGSSLAAEKVDGNLPSTLVAERHACCAK